MNNLFGNDSVHGVVTSFVAQTVLHIEGMSGNNPVVVNDPFDCTSHVLASVTHGILTHTKIHSYVLIEESVAQLLTTG